MGGELVGIFGGATRDQRGNRRVSGSLFLRYGEMLCLPTTYNNSMKNL